VLLEEVLVRGKDQVRELVKGWQKALGWECVMVVEWENVLVAVWVQIEARLMEYEWVEEWAVGWARERELV
jgi:hypothetical protein